MPISYLTRVLEFTASHRIRRADWADERNTREFGKASSEHSHRYQVRVTVKGPLHPTSGGVVNLGALDRLLHDEVTAKLDARRINDLPEFAEGGLLATGEALTLYLWERLAGRLPPGIALHAIRVQEGPHLYSEYFGEP
jgi:6-pyruvoyltetrahydropterin/6-carboxytetrahydropterin synthase